MSLAGLCLQLIGLEGYVVEAVDLGEERLIFVVGRTPDDRPRHLEISPCLTRARDADRRGYLKVKPIALVREPTMEDVLKYRPPSPCGVRPVVAGSDLKRWLRVRRT